jgi:hypothetical protein
LCSLSPNLGDTRTIVTHPASTTHSKLSVEERLAVSITDGLVRVSVGLETVTDVIADLEQALSKIFRFGLTILDLDLVYFFKIKSNVFVFYQNQNR